MSVEQLQLHQRINSDDQNPTLMGESQPRQPKRKSRGGLEGCQTSETSKEFDSESHSACAKNPP